MRYDDEMVDELRIRNIATTAATANLSSGAVSSVKTDLAIDSEGDPALRITIVIAPGAAERISGEAALATLQQIQKNLWDAGEERFPIVEYATEEELSEAID
jgi:hypothetical protein